MVTGTLVFILGIMVTEAIHVARHRIPIKVRWQQGELQTNYVHRLHHKQALLTNGIRLEFGVAEDGTLIWRPAK